MAQKKPFPRVRVALSMVLLVVAVLVYIQYQSSVLSAEEATVRSQLFILRDALDQYQADKGTCPESLSHLAAAKYIREIPVDPSTKSSTTWRFTLTQTERGTVCDVKTTSPKVSRDGVRYADW